MCFLAYPLAHFFPFHEAAVSNDTAAYIRICGLGVPASFIAAVFSSTFNGSGNSRAPFVVNGVGLGVNMILDPLLILVFHQGVRGAGWATIIAQWTVCIISFICIRKLSTRPFTAYPLRFHLNRKRLTQILKWGVPVGMETFCFCFLSMLCSRLEAGFGADAVAAGKIGSQMESLTWLIGGGFGSALVAFIGQNYGAGKEDRVRKGVKTATVMMALWGVFTTIFLGTAGIYVFALFLPQPPLVKLGKLYIAIFIYCQLPMNLEAVASGAFKGRGKTLQPSLVSVVTNLLKPGIAYLLTATTDLGIAGVWLGVCTPDVLRCFWVWAWYILYERKRRRT
jgi:putative MATE family efflux protein